MSHLNLNPGIEFDTPSHYSFEHNSLSGFSTPQSNPEGNYADKTRIPNIQEIQVVAPMDSCDSARIEYKPPSKLTLELVTAGFENETGNMREIILYQQ